ncbi:type IV secretory system conjugative DNA transfer family protein [Nocardia tengchongensis]|uniref:type IV secretory system conjugative DNA transfer family protein n=1 Tax=Nocardia tengchongensis TaxID=2055889 RepID=UPI0036131F51
MDRSVKAPREGMDPEWREVCGVAGVAVGVPALVEVAGLSVWLAPVFGGPAQDVPLRNPAGLGWHLFAEQSLQWPVEAWAGLGTIALSTVAGVVGSVWAWRAACEKCGELKASAGQKKAARKASKEQARTLVKASAANTLPRKPIRREAVDVQARYMARGGELDDLSFEAAAAKAADLKVRLGEDDVPGVLVARSVLDGRPLYASYEDLHLDIWGPRSGKSTSRVIPAVMEAVGPVVATSNKRDVVDATRSVRDEVGDVYVFDPQGVAEEPCTWYWDPIAWVAGPDGGEGAQERAAELAGHFAAAEDGATSGDNFFPQEGEDLLAALFLACALAKKPITQAFAWVTRADDPEPVGILDDSGFDLVAGALSSQYNAQAKQRDGVFGTAKKMAACLKYSRIRPWVTPPAKGEAPRRAFDVDAFVTSRDTLYPLSEESKSSAGPLVVALCAAVADAGKREGRRHPGGRLPVPLLLVLDEAANIVKWADLPKQYSHFGSRGMVVMTILQSWAQGVRCWGPDGMKALLSAANVLTLGAGLKDTGFLKDMSELVGHHYELVTSTSTSRGKGNSSRSTSTSRTTEVTLAPSDLSALPKGRVLVFVNGHRALLAETVPWFERPYADQIRAALGEDSESDNPQPTQAGRTRLRAVPPWTDEEGQTA